MELTFSEVADEQLIQLAIYLEKEFGRSVSEQRTNALRAHINILTTFQDLGPIYMIYRGFTVRKMVDRQSHVFYTIHNNAVYIVSITDTRMSPTNVRLLIKDELNRLK